jgi:hypothetical protein
MVCARTPQSTHIQHYLGTTDGLVLVTRIAQAYGALVASICKRTLNDVMRELERCGHLTYMAPSGARRRE